MECQCSSSPHEMWCPADPGGFDLGQLKEMTIQLTELENIGMDKPVVANIGGDYRRVVDARVTFYNGQFIVVLDTA
jgi:hypothetical protein